MIHLEDKKHLLLIIFHHCPECNGDLVRFESEADTYCVNVDCPAKIKEALVHFGLEKDEY